MPPRTYYPACLAAIILDCLAGSGMVISVDDLSIGSATMVVIYEGLPHPLFEPALYETEKA